MCSNLLVRVIVIIVIVLNLVVLLLGFTHRLLSVQQLFLKLGRELLLLLTEQLLVSHA